MECALWGWGGDGRQMYGDEVGTVVKYMGMGLGWKKIMGMVWEWG